MRFRFFLSAVVAVIFPLTAPAQQGPSGYHAVGCVKVKPGKDFRQWVTEGTHKLEQADADSGRIFAWYLLRSVMPGGASAACDYVTISLFPGAPPAPRNMDGLSAALKNAGITSSAQEYVDQRNSVVEQVSIEMWQNFNAVGTLKKGDYIVLNRMKVPHIGEWMAYEKKMWQPLAESMVKDGVMRGWFLNVPVFPGGSDLKYQASTVDVYPSWDAVFNGGGFPERFRRVHPGADMNQTFATFEKLRTIGATEVLSVEDVVAPAK